MVAQGVFLCFLLGFAIDGATAEDVTATLTQLVKDFHEFNEHDTASILDRYTEDFVSFGYLDCGDEYDGKAGVQAAMVEMASEGIVGLRLDENDEIFADDLGNGLGYTVSTADALNANDEVLFHVRTSIVWKNVDGSWKYHRMNLNVCQDIRK